MPLELPPSPDWATPAAPPDVNEKRETTIHYFTLVFFGVSLLVSLLFTGLISYHCWAVCKRRRRRRELALQSGAAGNQGDNEQPGLPELLHKEGVLVVQPDGCTGLACREESMPPQALQVDLRAQLQAAVSAQTAQATPSFI